MSTTPRPPPYALGPSATLPRTLLEGGATDQAEERAAAILRRALEMEPVPHPALGERIRRGVVERLARRPHSLPRWAWALAAVAGMIGLALVWRWPGHDQPDGQSYRVLAGTVGLDDETRVAPRQVVPLGRELRMGQSEGVLHGALARLELAGGSRFELSTPRLVALWRGRARFQVAPVAAGERFVVTTPEASVQVVGTVFTVVRGDDDITHVAVEEGVVRVLAGQEQVALTAGQRWTSAPPAQTVELTDLDLDLTIDSSSLGPAKPPRPPLPRMRWHSVPRHAQLDKARISIERGDLAGARHIYQLLSVEDGETAEAAMYLLARLELRQRHYEQTLEVLTDMGRRFPRGRLATERQLAALQVLILLERCDEAMAVAARFRALRPEMGPMLDVVTGAARAQARCF